MKRKLMALASHAMHSTGRARAALRTASLALPVMVLSHPVFAQTNSLPTVTPPDTALGGGSVSADNPVSVIGGLFRMGLYYVCIAVAVILCIGGAVGIYQTYQDLASGRATVGHFVMHALIGCVVVGVGVFLGSMGISYLG